MKIEKLIINDIEIELERKSIKHLHLSVYPPDGRVHISAPESYTDEQIRHYVLKKWLWIVEKRKSLPSSKLQDLVASNNALYQTLIYGELECKNSTYSQK